MKRLFFILIVLVASLSTNAQSIMLYKNGQVEKEMDITAIDSIVYCPSEDESLPILGYYIWIEDVETWKPFTPFASEEKYQEKLREKLNELFPLFSPIRFKRFEKQLPFNDHNYPIMLTKEQKAPICRLHTEFGWTDALTMRSCNAEGEQLTTIIEDEIYYVWWNAALSGSSSSSIRFEITLDAE